ncbi:MAG: UDP-N-acetylmuramoyl-tripeptide--D-alanyl-D-alanine ligase [Candidatus Omnitrophota bacterium]|jgi:UDP-N-acetylmuramoyl-tripeptide--D-alanyl-D-alanine ligase|nr:MAG: UDP-N-acetylmuramoyl-tripeptide--D-alanyl-D-alanine ligase [Candidatus Omnitrophota bacterium]
MPSFESNFYSVILLCAAWKIVLRFLQFFQQEEYDNLRFLRWWIRTRSFEKRATGTVMGLAILGIPVQFLHSYAQWVIFFVVAACFVNAGWSHHFPASKKPLVMTARAKRIVFISFLLLLVFQNALSQLGKLVFPAVPTITLLLFACGIVLFCIPLALVAANIVLAPFEYLNQRRYVKEAKQILRDKNPHIIGITGSYGKTSTKHILAHILAAHSPTLATPGSVNTRMGITRIIRERLRDEHRFFIVEMGAYKIGSIRSLCAFTPPKSGMITAIGLAHWERFQSIETVTQAKSELVRALPPGGIAVLNGDDPQCRKIAENLHIQPYFYGLSAENGRVDCRIRDIEVTPTGTDCVFEYGGRQYKIHIPLFGNHQVLNTAAAFLMSVLLSVPPIVAVAALRSLPPISHRLVVNRGGDGITIIDDSYNSNPSGFLSALDVLQSLPGERKILVTPGMVELGDKKEEEHLRIAAHAAKMCHRICLIAPERIPEMRSGLLQNGFPSENIHEFASLLNAREWMNGFLRAGDVVLFENDLPDVYESPSAFS